MCVGEERESEREVPCTFFEVSDQKAKTKKIERRTEKIQPERESDP